MARYLKCCKETGSFVAKEARKGHGRRKTTIWLKWLSFWVPFHQIGYERGVAHQNISTIRVEASQEQIRRGNANVIDRSNATNSSVSSNYLGGKNKIEKKFILFRRRHRAILFISTTHVTISTARSSERERDGEKCLAGGILKEISMCSLVRQWTSVKSPLNCVRRDLCFWDDLRVLNLMIG